MTKFPTEPKALSAAIKAARMSKRLSQPEVANALGIPLSRYIGFESFGKKGYQVPNMVTVKSLEKLLLDAQPDVEPHKQSFLKRIRSWFK